MDFEKIKELSKNMEVKSTKESTRAVESEVNTKFV